MAVTLTAVAATDTAAPATVTTAQPFAQSAPSNTKKNDRGMDETAGFVGAGVRPGQGSEESKGEAARSLSEGQTISATDEDALDTEAGGDGEPSHWLGGG